MGASIYEGNAEARAWSRAMADVDRGSASIERTAAPGDPWEQAFASRPAAAPVEPDPPSAPLPGPVPVDPDELWDSIVDCARGS